MVTQDLNIERAQLNKLLAAASGDAALLYIYLKSGNDPEQAEKELRIPETRLSCAMATLRQLGLWQPTQKHVVTGDATYFARYSKTPVPQTDDYSGGISGVVLKLLLLADVGAICILSIAIPSMVMRIIVSKKRKQYVFKLDDEKK